MSTARFHVVRRKDQWRVERDGGIFAVGFDTLEQAVRAAEARARIAEPATVTVHDETGQVRDERRYGDDPGPAPGPCDRVRRPDDRSAVPG